MTDVTNTDSKSTNKIWVGDKLNREEEGKWLIDYLIAKYNNNIDEKEKSFVLNLNADWGFGKTYFLENLKLELESRNHQVVYFDAWKNDFSDKPLLGFISEINNSLSDFMDNESSDIKKINKSIKDKLSIVSKSAAPLIAGFVARQLIGASLEQVQNVFSDGNEENETDEPENNKVIEKQISSLVTKAAQAALVDHQNTKKAIDEFKDNLKILLEFINNKAGINMPLFIFVDELDRCRPTFSIDLLETIKHLFDVNGVYFIIATASDQLSHSINAIYGTNFESKLYLNRFFDQEYQLAKPERDNYCDYLWNKYIGSESVFIPAICDQFYKEKNENVDINILLFSKFAEFSNASLRDIEQAVSILYSINLTYESHIYSNIIFHLVFAKIRHPKFYKILEPIWYNINSIGSDAQLEISAYVRKNFNNDIIFSYYDFSVNSITYRSTHKTTHTMGMYEIFNKTASLHNTKFSELHKKEQDGNSIENLFYQQEIRLSKHSRIPNIIDFSSYINIINQVGRIS